MIAGTSGERTTKEQPNGAGRLFKGSSSAKRYAAAIQLIHSHDKPLIDKVISRRDNWCPVWPQGSENVEGPQHTREVNEERLVRELLPDAHPIPAREPSAKASSDPKFRHTFALTRR